MHERLLIQLRRATAPNGTVDMAHLLAEVSDSYAADEQSLERLRGDVRAEADARFNVVMDNVGEAVITVGPDGRMLTFNRAAEDMFGYAAAAVVGCAATMLIPEERGERLRAALEEFMAGGEAYPLQITCESEGRRHDGNVFPIQAAIAEVRHDGLRQLVGIIRDTSLQVETERQLRESEGRFRDLVGSASDWFWETDSQHRLTFVSERIGNVLGVKASAIIGATFFDLGLADDSQAAEAHRGELESRQPFRDRIFHVGPAAGYDSRVIRISGIPVFDPAGAFTGYRGVGVDITREVVAERRAHRAQQLLVDAIDRIVDGLAIFDADDRLVMFNPEYRKLFSETDNRVECGMSFAALLGGNIGIFDTAGVPAEEWMERRVACHRAATGEPFVVRLINGRWILSREFRMADGGIVALRTDITELKQREEELESLRRLYRLILDTAGEGIVGLDADGGVTFANRRAADLLGHAPEQMTGQNFQALVGTALPVTTSHACEVQFSRADGSVLPADTFVSPIHEAGRVVGAVAVFHDATLRLRYEQTLADTHRELERLVAERTAELTREVASRARTEQALRDSRERLKGVSDSLFEGVLVINRGGLLSFANPSARAQLDLEDEPEGVPIDGVLTIRARVGEERLVPWRGVLEGDGNMCDNDAVFETASGKTLDVAYACTAVHGDDGVRGAVISFRDMSPLKAAQREALQSSRMASVGQLAAGIAHEINTPIQYVGDNLRFISDSMADIAAAVSAGRDLGNAAFDEAMDTHDVAYLLDEIPRAVSQSLEGVAQVARIVLSMKEFSHPGSTSKTMADINRALESTLTVTRNTWKHVAQVECQFQPDLPAVPCYAGELNQVFLNIIINAAHAIEAAQRGDHGRIRVSTAQEGEWVVIRIADNGTGIPDNIRDKIFDPFFTTKDVGKGTGQGLAISRDVVLVKHGGRLEVDSRDGDGATFTIRLPLGADTDGGEDLGETP